MIYVELQLDGKVRVYEMADRLVLVRVAVDANAQCLPIPRVMSQAHDFIRAGCYQFEMFESLQDAEDWADGYQGFRAAEVRAELDRFEVRRASFSALGVVVAA
jgi:hypothetical protein